MCVASFFPFHLKVFWRKVRPHDSHMQPQGTVWKKLVAQVLPLIQVSICPRHRLYPVSPCDDVQQEMASYYPPLQCWVKSTKDAIKLITTHCLSQVGEWSKSGGKSMASWGSLLHSMGKKIEALSGTKYNYQIMEWHSCKWEPELYRLMHSWTHRIIWAEKTLKITKSSH